jgi:kynureninase
LIEKSAFPSDRYAVVSQLAMHGLASESHLIEVEPRRAEQALRTEDLVARIEALGPRLALVLLPGVQYLTGQALDLAAVVASARRSGAAVGLDLAHSIGNTLLELHDWGADFAVWCSYKYLNGGPGAIGGCFVHARHARRFDLPRLAGWWGHDARTRFEMSPAFQAADGAAAWAVSNPPIFSAAPLRASLPLFAEAGMAALRRKSQALTGYFASLVSELAGERVASVTPADPAQRGCQLSLRIVDGATAGRALYQALSARGVVCDWREPDIMRVAPVPLYNSFEDVLRGAWTLCEQLPPRR